MNKHTFLAFLAFLHEEIKRRFPEVVQPNTQWPDAPMLYANFKANVRYFPLWQTGFPALQRRMAQSGFIDVGPCTVGVHRCRHYRLTEKGWAELERLNREGCPGAGCKHLPMKKPFKAAA